MAAVDAGLEAAARGKLWELVETTRCNPLLIRLAWHDSGSYDKDVKDQPWPKPGGATASIRFRPELGFPANNGLDIALGLLKPLKESLPEELGWSDLIQLGSAVGVEQAGGPKIPLRLGRLDAATPEDCTPDGRLPAAAAPWPDKAASPAAHLRRVFGRMGLSDQDIVALSGAHTLGRSRPERSGHGRASTKYTEAGPGTPGGQSWTAEWLKFDNSYFVDVKEQKDADLLVLATDACIFEDEGFRPHAEKYAADQAAFFEDYVQAHLRLSELGVKWA
jgi:L-ascorbate peroxidase